MYKIRIATEEGINIIDAIDMLEAMKKLFERISKDKMNSFLDSTKVFARKREVDLEADFVCRR